MNNRRWGLGIRHHESTGEVARQAVLEAARRCYVRHGMGVTCTMIADEAKIARPTVYRYFESAEQIRMQLVKRIWLPMKPPSGSAIAWIDTLRLVKEFRLGTLCLTIGPLYTDLETVVLCGAETVQDEAVARLFLSYLKIDALTGDPLPVFSLLLCNEVEDGGTA